MNEAMTVKAVRKTVTVGCPIEEAFRIFTADAGSWWPTESHSIHGDKAQQVVFEEHEGGEVYEISESGEKGHWATVIAWEPPNRVVLAWEVSPKSLGTEVEVRFTAQERATRVDLEHRGWERVPEPVERESYDTGWDYVLGRYEQRI
jgi:uncharacterized protein YndB with AHSA1/START domain